MIFELNGIDNTDKIWYQNLKKMGKQNDLMHAYFLQPQENILVILDEQ